MPQPSGTPAHCVCGWMAVEAPVRAVMNFCWSACRLRPLHQSASCSTSEGCKRTSHQQTCHLFHPQVRKALQHTAARYAHRLDKLIKSLYDYEDWTKKHIFSVLECILVCLVWALKDLYYVMFCLLSWILCLILKPYLPFHQYTLKAVW